jgi:hypothetical protein
MRRRGLFGMLATLPFVRPGTAKVLPELDQRVLANEMAGRTSNLLTGLDRLRAEVRQFRVEIGGGRLLSRTGPRGSL